MELAVVERVEKIIVKAWPSEIEKRYHSWLLRINRGVSKRANSVFTVGAMPEAKNWLEEIEMFYRKHSLPPCFYISEASPQELDETLKMNGYETVNEMFLLYHKSDEIIAQVKQNEDLSFRFEQFPNESWLDAFIYLEGHADVTKEAYDLIFKRIRIPSGFLTVKLDETIVALGTVAAKDGWGYISNVVVNDSFRRRGYGSQVIRALANWAVEHQTKHVFLQVLKTNHAGMELYHRLGFSKLSESHFRLKTKPLINERIST